MNLEKIYQNLSEREINRLKLLKKDVKLICIKNYKITGEFLSFSSDCFEDYYNYYNDNIGDFTRGKVYQVRKCTHYQADVECWYNATSIPGKMGFNIFREIENSDSPYLFDYFMFEHEWVATNRDEKIDNILN
jgi:hypothetical protein